MAINDIHYFPGHMQKALREISNKIKDCDGIIEVIDARAINASFPINLDSLINNKIKIAVLTKSDIASISSVDRQANFLKSKGFIVYKLDVRNVSDCQKLTNYLNSIKSKKDEKFLKLGFPITKKRYMILGIPNVGKSTLINSLCKKYKAQVENKPGKTRAETLIQVSKYVEIYDTPGILSPNYEDKNLAYILASIGSLKIENFNKVNLSDFVLDFLKNKFPTLLIEKYSLIDEVLDKNNEEILMQISKKRNFYLQNNVIDIERARYLLLKDFRNGYIGRISFDE